MLKNLRPRSAYDVIALIALFVAVGTGGAYAANEWTGENIVDGSLTGADIRGQGRTSTQTPIDGSLDNQDIKDGGIKIYDLATGSVNGERVVDNSLTGLDVAESTLGEVPSADRLDERDSTDFLASDAVRSVRVMLAESQSKPVLKSGPFTLSARCDPFIDSRGKHQTRFRLLLQSSEPGSIAVGNTRFRPSETPQLLYSIETSEASQGGTGPEIWGVSREFWAAAPGGDSLHSQAGVGINVLGSDCVVDLLAISP